eukprot:8488620-Pyramimonas_sp.AAC.1
MLICLLGASWGPLGAALDASEALSEPSWNTSIKQGNFNEHCPSRVRKVASWTRLGALSGHSWALLGPSWGSLGLLVGPSYAILEPSWGLGWPPEAKRRTNIIR